MRKSFSFTGVVQKFDGSSGWIYVSVPQQYTEDLKQHRTAWGMYPIRATVGDTTWDTKLMVMKGDQFFVALKAAVRKKENIVIGQQITITVQLM